MNSMFVLMLVSITFTTTLAQSYGFTPYYGLGINPFTSPYYGYGLSLGYGGYGGYYGRYPYSSGYGYGYGSGYGSGYYPFFSRTGSQETQETQQKS